jgi:hypothetical protein
LGENKTKNGEKQRKRIKLGAPSEYKPVYCQKMIDYFRDYVEEERGGIPEFIEFALEIGVSDETLRNWRDKYEAFGKAYKLCKAIQKWYLQKTGLSGKNNPRMTQFLLSANFKVSEYSRRKPEEKESEEGLSTGDIELLRRLEDRLKSGETGGRPTFNAGEEYGSVPYEEDEDE